MGTPSRPSQFFEKFSDLTFQNWFFNEVSFGFPTWYVPVQDTKSWGVGLFISLVKDPDPHLFIGDTNLNTPKYYVSRKKGLSSLEVDHGETHGFEGLISKNRWFHPESLGKMNPIVTTIFFQLGDSTTN